MALGLLFFARIDDPDTPFDPEAHAREDLEILRATVSHARQECAIITLECRNPEGGLLGGPRWGILSIERNGVPEEIARGQITGFPVALSGQTVSVELMCRRATHVTDVDALFATRNPEVPVELVDESVERRTEQYLLDEVYHDRRTLTASLEPISGSAAPALTIYGEGAAAGESQIIGMTVSMPDTPVSRVTVKLEAHHEEQAWGQFNAATALAGLDPARSETYTPDSLRSALQSVTLDGGYEQLSAIVETIPQTPLTVFTTERGVDPATCGVIHAETVSIMRHRIDEMTLDCAVTATQPRREIVSISVDLDLSGFSGATEEIEETLYLSEAEGRARTSRIFSYKTGRYTMRQFARRGVAASVFSSGGDFRSGCADIVEAVARYAARIAMDRAHCYWLRIDVPAEVILDLDLRDRVRVIDARLPGGQATGKVIGWDLEFGSSDAGQLVLACPIAGGTADAATLDLSDIRIEGPIDIDSTPVLDAVKSGDALTLVTKFEVIDAAPEQYEVIGHSAETAPVENPLDALPQTGVSLELLDLSPVDYETLEPTRIRIRPFNLTLPRGATA